MVQSGLSKPPVFLLKGAKKWGIIEPEKRLAYLDGNEVLLGGTRVYELSESITIQGDRYTVVRFSPALLHHVARRGAQVIQPKDAAYMISRSGTGIGSRVLESGIGTGIFTSHILWAIGPGGLLHSIDRNPESVEIARKNLEKFLDLENWEPSVMDISEFSGREVYDTVFLDLPEPWAASSVVGRHTGPGSMLVTYLPTFDQVERTVHEFVGSGFVHEETTELISRQLLVRNGATRPDNVSIGHTAFISFFRKTSGS